MTYPNDDRPAFDRRRGRNATGWIIALICVIAVVVAAIYYTNRDRTTASNQNGSSPVTTGSSTGNATPANK